MSTNSTKLTYVGTVKTTLKNKKTVKHNSATKYMSQLLLKMLAHSSEYKLQEMPYYIQLIKNSKADIVKNPSYKRYVDLDLLCFNQFILAHPDLKWSNGDLSLSFTAVFDRYYLRSQAPIEGDICLVLVSKDSSNILAVSEFDNAYIDAMVSQNAQADYQANIEWSISFETATETNGEEA